MYSLLVVRTKRQVADIFYDFNMNLAPVLARILLNNKIEMT